MNIKKKIPLGIIVFIAIILILGLVYLLYLGFYLMLVEGYLSLFLSLTPITALMLIDIILTLSALFIIPRGFVKQRNNARIYAIIFLTWSAFGALAYMLTTGDILIRYGLFALYILLIAYLFLSPVQTYFQIPQGENCPILQTFTYGDYTLYSRLVRLKSGKIQLIYFFSKKTPKSGHPAVLPDGYRVNVSSRSGLPYLKKI